MRKQVAGTRHTARQHQQVSICVVALLELDVRLDIHAVSRLHERELRGAHRYNFYTAATQHVDRNQGLDILEAVSQKHINFCHNLAI